MIVSSIAILFLIFFGRFISKRFSNDNLESIFFKRIFLISFITRIFLMFAFYFVLVNFFPQYNSFITGANNDESVYDSNGIEIADAWHKGYTPPIYLSGSIAYNYLNAIIYFIFGHNIFLVRILGAFVGSLIPIFIYKISNSAYNDERIAKITAILTAFLPSMLIYSILQIKEIHIMFSIVFIIWGLIKLRVKLSITLLIMVILTWVYLMLLRFYFGYILLATSLIYLITNHHIKHHLTITIAVALLCILSIVFIQKIGIKSITFIDNLMAYTSLQPEEHYFGKSETNAFYSVSKTGGVLFAIPINILYSFIMPYLWWPAFNPNYHGYFGTWVFMATTIVWYIFIPFCIYGFVCSVRKRNNEVMLLVLIVLSTLAMLSLSSQGVITVGRTKDTIMPILMIFASLGIISYRQGAIAIRLVLLIYMALQYFGSLLYIFLREPSVGIVFIKSSIVVILLAGADMFLKCFGMICNLDRNKKNILL